MNATEQNKSQANPHGIAHFIQQYYPQYWNKICSYPAGQCACIRKTTDEWGILGNFGASPLTVDGVVFKNAEQLYQLMKFKDEEALKAIHSAGGMWIKRKAKHYEKEIRRPDWGRYFIDALKFCLMTKYEQCAAFRDALERSKGLYIIEDETNRKKGEGQSADAWGAKLIGDHYVGPSLLGQLLMELRDTGKLTYSLPADALDFIQLLK